MLGTYHRLLLSQLARRYIWLEETNERINESSIGYMMNPRLYKSKAFKEQVKGCSKNTFGPSTNTHIGKITRKMFRVLSCVIYKIIRKYVCVDYLGYEKSKLSDLRIGVYGRYKSFDMDYDNVLGIEIPDLLLNLLSC